MKDIIESVTEIIEEAAAMKNAYFWTPPLHASQRRAYEQKHSHPEVSWTEGGNQYTAEYTVTCSCHNVYAYGTYTRNGSRTTLTTIKNSLRRLKESAA